MSVSWEFDYNTNAVLCGRVTYLSGMIIFHMR